MESATSANWSVMKFLPWYFELNPKKTWSFSSHFPTYLPTLTFWQLCNDQVSGSFSIDNLKNKTEKQAEWLEDKRSYYEIWSQPHWKQVAFCASPNVRYLFPFGSTYSRRSRPLKRKVSLESGSFDGQSCPKWKKQLSRICSCEAVLQPAGKKVVLAASPSSPL